MSKIIPQSTKDQIINLRRDERLSSLEIRKRLPTLVSLTTICELLKSEIPSKKRHRKEWTELERRILSRLWRESPPEKLLEMLAGRTWGAIARQAASMRLKRSRSASKRAGPYHIDPIFKRLREIREERNIGRQELADRMGIHKIMLARYELGESRPSWLIFRTWIDALRCEVAIK